jgi:outer membrane protein assembly factor BamB
MKWAMAATALVAILACAVPAAYGDDWPQFRGPNRDGKSAETGLLKSWPEGGPKLLWTAKGCGEGFGSPVVVGSAIYIIGDANGAATLTNLDTEGQHKGQVVFGKTNPSDPNRANGSRSTPTYYGSASDASATIYVSGAWGEVACFDAKTFSKQWEVNVKDEFHGTLPTWKYAESPLVDGDNLICTPGGMDAGIVALDRKTGKTVWTSKGLSDSAGYSSCVKMTVDKLPMIVTMTGKGLVGVSAKTGQFLWRYDRPANKIATCPSPVFLGNRVFEATGYGAGGGAVDLAVSANGVTATQAWETKDMVCHHGGYVLVDGYIYGNNGGGWACIDFKTGQTKWKDTGVGKGCIIYADGMLYTQTENTKTREIGLVKASPEAFTMVSKFALPAEGANQLWAHPAIANGRLYVRHGDVLYCYDIKGGDAKPAK